MSAVLDTWVGDLELRPLAVLRLQGFRVDDHGLLEVFCWCGHRWNAYGWLPGDTLRYPHCRECSDAGLRHLYVDAGRLTGPARTSLLRRYHGQGDRWMTERQVDAWRQRQLQAAARYYKAADHSHQRSTA